MQPVRTARSRATQPKPMNLCRESNQDAKKRRPRILLGVTGSVAAIKAPQIAIQLIETLDCDVQIVLTHTGEVFWEQAGGYNEEAWKKFNSLNFGSDSKPGVVALHGMLSNSSRMFQPFAHPIILRTRCQVGMATVEENRRYSVTHFPS